MIRARLYIPASVDVDGATTFAAVNQAAFFDAMKWRTISRWPEFRRWSLADNMLILELTHAYWVMAYIEEGLDELSLPEWTPVQ
jgi:hypothetical protein